MTTDESSLIDFKRCLVAAVIRCFQSSHRRTIVQLCQAFHAHWNFPPPGFELKFVQLAEGWFSPDIRTALVELARRGWVQLTDGENTTVIKHFFDAKCMADIYAGWPAISEHIQWVMMTAISIEEELRRMSDPYAPPLET
jgi:hypothetical protein